MELRDDVQRALGTAYAIDREITGGGMSRVFVARDAALNREIVVKVLRPDLASGVSVERFKREISLAAALQHPHIVPLLAAGEVDGLPFYTMPFVRGESLRARLVTAGTLSVNEAMHVLRDIAGALAHAHNDGVVHRDIKPENVLLSGGVAVVTDFGVAKAVDAASTTPDHAHAGLTSVGIALGTPAYMSPEQASADPTVDHRADIYSFGCVAYEMLSGKSPFGNRPPQQILAAHVLESPEPLATHRPDVPEALAALVMACLEKRADDRPQSAGHLLTALDGISTPSGGTVPTRVKRTSARRTRLLVWAGAVVALAAVSLSTWLALRPRESFGVAATRLVTAAAELEVDPAISPNGKLVAYAAGPIGAMRIFVRQLTGGPAIPLSATITGDHRWPRWSPDGEQILFVAIDRSKPGASGDRGGLAYLVPYVGGTPQLAIEAENSGVITPAWSPDGKLFAYSDGRQILLKPVGGGAPTRLVEGVQLYSPAFSPDGRRLAYVSGNLLGEVVFNIATSSIWTVAIPDGRPVRLTDSTRSNTAPVWPPGGNSVFFISNLSGERDVYRQRVTRGGEPTGAPVPLTAGLGASAFSLSADGTRAVYSVLRLRSQVWFAPILPSGVTPASAMQRVTKDAEAIEGLDVSRDGKWLTYDSNRSGNQDIYKILIDGGEAIQLTTDPAPDHVPQWSADGREIAYYSQRTGNRDIRVMSAEGRDDRPVTRDSTHEVYPTWAPDGRRIAFALSDFRSQGRLKVVARDARGNWSEERELTSASGAQFPRWSPDGQWISYVHGRRVNATAPSGAPTRVVLDTGSVPDRLRFAAWGRDPTTMYVRADSANVAMFWAIPLSGASPRLLLRLDGSAYNLRRQEFATDGRRLFFTLATDESDIFVMDLKR